MEEELDRDIAEHIAIETDDNIARGMSPAEARHAALRKFGNVARVMEDTRREWRWAALDTWFADIRQGFRRLRRSPGTSALAVLSLALAFAPSVTMFSAMDHFFLSPLPIKNPAQIVEIQFRDTGPHPKYPYRQLSYPDFQDFTRSLHSASGLTFQAGHGAMIRIGGRRSVAGVNIVNDDYFRVLGIRLERGPGLSHGRPSLVISHGFWSREFGSRPDVIGQSLLVDDFAFTVGGVAGAEFHGTERMLEPDLWIPIETWQQVLPEFRAWVDQRDDRFATVWARLQPGVSMEQASAEVKSIARELADRYPATNASLVGMVFSPLADRKRGGIVLTSFAVILLGILLAVACANVTGILLARAEERRHETAIRQALGASRGRLIREWMIESAVVSTMAAALGLAGAKVLMNLLPGLMPDIIIPLHYDFGFGTRVWLYAVSLIFASALTFGLVPAWRGSRPDLLSGLRHDSAVSVLRVRVPIRSLLIVTQVAAAEILLFGAGLVWTTLSSAFQMHPGFDPNRSVATATLLGTNQGGGPSTVNSEALAARLARLGGVRNVAYGHSLPLSLDGNGGTHQLVVPGQEPRDVRGGSVGPGFLSLLGTPILAGRDLRAGDQNAVLVNSMLARQLDPAGTVLGREIRLDGAVRQIVGVLPEIQLTWIHDPPEPQVFVLTPPRGGNVVFAVEVKGDPRPFVAALRRELLAASPDATVLSAKTLRQHYRDALFLELTATKLFYGLGLLALALTVAGLHGISSALFARRSKEFAIRMALGAAPRQIMGSVLTTAVKLAACGLAIGLVIALPAGMWLASKVPGLSGWSIAAVGFSSAIVMAAAVAAAAQPAARVLRIQPGEIVRAE